MNILITGASGFLARQLVPALLAEQHQLILLGRDPKQLKQHYQQALTFISWHDLNTISPDTVDVIIHLAGENIGASRWNQATKNKIKASRVDTTQAIVEWAAKANDKKPHLYNASAIGTYGIQVNQTTPLVETTIINWDKPTDFLSEVGIAWELAANQALSVGVPLTILRFGVMLKRNEGMLKKLAPAFSLGLGSVLGDGNQIISWVHVDDVVAAIIYLLKHPDITGVVNVTAPQAVSQKEFAKTLATIMRRPLILTMPAWMINMMFGQMGQELLLGGQSVYPERLLKSGFTFTYPTLITALTNEWHYKT